MRAFPQAFLAASVVVLLVAVHPSFAASESEPAGEAVQPPEDDKSYLPPWMQKQDAPKLASSESPATAVAVNDPLTANKSLSPKPVRRQRNDAFLWRGFGFFGR